ncbi:protein VACUOLELESS GAMETOPHYTES-like [Apium graveolens]|uniref:protein VACUOLELESS GAMETOPHYTES-like n=1 Tax=Apium graveolens TaxID=4045 RepID=UPI003D7B8A9E
MMSNRNVKHFSHPHSLTPLEQEQELVTFNCRGCERKISEPFHGCSKCKYYLHDECLEAPLSISHPSHPSHHLNLLPFPSYSSRSFICNGCGLRGKAFVYHCSLCSFDLHTYCAVSPDTIILDKHPHELQLVYDPQDRFKNAIFKCDLCNAEVDRKSWVYYCGDCDYGAHLYCGLSAWWPLKPKLHQKNDVPADSDRAQTHSHHREESHKDKQPKALDERSVTPVQRPQGQKCDCGVEHLSLAMDEVTEIQIKVAKLQNLLTKINMSYRTPQV